MICLTCGADLVPGSRFCSACGTGVTDPGAATVMLATAQRQDHLLNQLRQVRGTGQTASAGTALPKALTVRAVDADGLPVAGVAVTFTVTSGGGNLGGPTVSTVTTNPDGLAEVPFVLGPAAGTGVVTAAAAGLGSVTFTATGS